MQETFVFWGSVSCLIVGTALCLTPASRYLFASKVGWFAVPLLFVGLVLMTTFKWTEVAIKMSDLELKFAEAQKEAEDARRQLAAIKDATDPAAETATLRNVLDNYRIVAKVPPSLEQINSFTKALRASSVTIVPTSVITAQEILNDGSRTE